MGCVVKNSACGVCNLSACALGLAFGIAFALLMLVIGTFAWYLNTGEAWEAVVRSLYYGFALTVPGILIGAIWAFVEGYLLGFLIAKIYNLCVRCCVCKSCKPADQGK